ncbi:glycosyltransferase [bacterium]|nr:glycosyltransferase [bacterium]
MENEIKVSIVCNAYNHEKYIKKALDGFLMQKTSFKYEVLVHDDASTDGTADIIREYQQKYPDIIKPILQKENQYSQKIRISYKYQFPRAVGKYIAICEGDDFWTDENKLQKQFDIMEQHGEVDMCAHAAQCIDAETGESGKMVRPKKNDMILRTDEVITGGGDYLATNSLFFRKSLLDNTPEYVKVSALDYMLQIYGSCRGGIYYLDEVMSVYRVNVKNSWTTVMRANTDKKISFKKKLIGYFKLFNRETGYKYKTSVFRVILWHYATIVILKFKILLAKFSK